MIDYERYLTAMKSISDRCAKPLPASEIARYYRFLSPRLTTVEFLESARGIWSSSEFFPPPVKFLEARVGLEWDRVVELLRTYTPPQVPAGWADQWQALAPETKKTISRLGGPLGFKEKQYDRDVPRAYGLFIETYKVALQDIAATEMIEPPEDPPRLTEGSEADG